MAYTLPQPNQSVSGIVGASIIGLPYMATAGSVATVIIGGSIAASFPANQSVSGTVGASVIGTVPVVQSGVHYVSVVGGFPEGNAHGADTGLFTLGVRNDSLASVTASDVQYTRFTVGPAGETITANAPLTKWVSGVASCFTGVIQPIISAQGSSVFTYITGLQVANASANNTYLTLYGGAGSVIGYTVVPANGGSNVVYINGLKTTANGAFSASLSGVASVFLTAEGFISKL